MHTNSTHNPPKIAVYCSEHDAKDRALELSLHLQLPLLEELSSDYALVLRVGRSRLDLYHTTPDAPGPVYADFLEGRAGHRWRAGEGRRQPLGRALGLKPNYDPLIVDATAGLGRDSFVMACMGCNVQALERSPVIACLLEDGLQRGRADSELKPVLDRIQLQQADAITWLSALAPDAVPNVIYLDPMFPHRDKSALVKKEMRAFREVVGDDGDASALLATALHKALDRVVVKRPRLAPIIDGPVPSTKIEGKSTRYDVYVIAALRPKNSAS